MNCNLLRFLYFFLHWRVTYSIIRLSTKPSKHKRYSNMFTTAYISLVFYSYMSNGKKKWRPCGRSWMRLLMVSVLLLVAAVPLLSWRWEQWLQFNSSGRGRTTAQAEQLLKTVDFPCLSKNKTRNSNIVQITVVVYFSINKVLLM